MKLKKSNIVLICLAVVYFINISIHNIVIIRKQMQKTSTEQVSVKKDRE